MRTTTSYSFYCRQSKIDRNGQAPVELGICINGTRKFLNLPFKCSPADFNKKRRPKYIDDYIDAQRVKVATIVTDMLNHDIPLTTESLREYLRTGGVKSYTIKDLFDDYFRILSKKVEVSITMKVYEKYKLVKRQFSEFIDFSKECNAVTPSVIQEFYAELRKKYKDSTSSGMMTKLKTIVKYGMDNGHIKINPFQGTKINKGKGDIIYLTEPELKRIVDCQIDNVSLSNVRDAFVLQASTGLAYCDILGLKESDIKTTEDGTYYITKQRQKTGTTYTSVVMPAGVEVLKKHGGQVPKIISNQKYNLFLKNIQALSGVTTTLTTHVARRTYATTLLNRGVRIETVSKCLGHANVRITQAAYAEFLDDTIIKEVEKVL